jgi:uncharacterized integral membrane protein (TIGR00697 family)
MNILASKQVDIFMFTINLGLFISPIVFIVNDIQSEIFGYKNAKNMIRVGLVVNIAVAIIYFTAIKLPPSSNYHNQEAFYTVLGSTTRITIASIIAYYIGSLINSKVMTSMKKRYEKYLFFRAITSTIFGQIMDNVVFMTLSFIGVLPVLSILSMIVGGTIIEVLYEVVFYPLTRILIKTIKKNSGNNGRELSCQEKTD